MSATYGSYDLSAVPSGGSVVVCLSCNVKPAGHVGTGYDSLRVPRLDPA